MTTLDEINHEELVRQLGWDPAVPELNPTPAYSHMPDETLIAPMLNLQREAKNFRDKCQKKIGRASCRERV